MNATITAASAVSVAGPESTGEHLLTRTWVKDKEHGGRRIARWSLRPAAPATPTSAVNTSNRDDAHWDAICFLSTPPRDRNRARWGRPAGR